MPFVGPRNTKNNDGSPCTKGGWTWTPAVKLAGAVLVFCVALSVGTAGAVTLTAGDLRLAIDQSGRVTAIAVGDRQLRVEPCPLVTLCEDAGGRWWNGSVRGGNLDRGLILEYPDAKATVVLTVKPRGEALRFQCAVEGAAMPARGLLLRLTFPLDASGWLWHNDLQQAKPIRTSGVYENVVPLHAWPDLPEWKGQPGLRLGYSNRNFCSVVTGPVGLCLAVPLDRPCIHRTAYHGSSKRLEIVYDFALSPDTRAPNRVEFSFDLYACDPEWGFRGALAKYYALNLEMFRNYVKEPGQWMPFTQISAIDNPNEFYFGVQWGGKPELELCNRLGVLGMKYFSAGGMGANVPDYDPEKDPLPSHEAMVRAMDAAFKRRTGIEGLFEQVGMYNAAGKLDVSKTFAYSHIQGSINLDPRLPYGRWILKHALETIDEMQRTENARLDGFGFDGLSAGINYRPGHFRTADSPCLWDPVAKKPLLNNFFSSCQFARAAAELLRPRGRVAMLNGAMGASYYATPWLDILGAETGLQISRPSINYLRAVAYHKPCLMVLKGNYHQKLGHLQIEQYLKQGVAHGLFPGCFDWPVSGLGPGSSYWDHPAYYERDRGLFRKYQLLCRALSNAGWEPVTHARCPAPQVFVERFGPTPDGLAWFTLCNEGKASQRTILTVQARKLNMDPKAVKALELVAEEPVLLSAIDERLLAHVEIPPGDVRLVQIAPPDVLWQWRIGQALDTLDRGVLMRQMDREKPPLAVYWRSQGPTYSRRSVGRNWHLTLLGNGRAASSTKQWVMLFQQRPEDLLLRVRAGGKDLIGKPGEVGVECQLAWVTPRFTHYETQFFDLPTGTYEEKEFQFSIRCSHPLRSIHLGPKIARAAKGSLELASLSLSGPDKTEYVVDPTLTRWYEPFPPELRDGVEAGIQDLRSRLLKLSESIRAQRTAIAPMLREIRDRSRKLQETIHQRDADDGCRRVLRDLYTVGRLLQPPIE